MLYLMIKGKLMDFPNKPSTPGFIADMVVSEVSIYLSFSNFYQFL